MRIRSSGWFVFFVCFLIWGWGARAESVRFLPEVISFGGIGPAFVKAGGKQTEAKVGQVIEYGSLIKTGPENTITIQYPDQSILSIDADTEIEIQERSGGAQKSKLNTGQIRASVIKLKTGQVIPNKPRFMVRTRAAVMGVRGTEFVMAVDPTGYTTQVHTLEGVVDFAADEKSLLSGKATSVESGKFVEATERGLSPARVFDREQFIQSLAPPVPGGPAAVVFTNPAGLPIPTLDVLKLLGDPKDKEAEPPAFIKEEQEQKQKNQVTEPAVPLESAKPEEENLRRVRIASFQGAFLYTSAFSKPEFAHAGLPDVFRGAVLSWNPSLPIPLTGFLSLRGHLGVILSRQPGSDKKAWGNETQLFANFTIFNKFFVEAGAGKQLWFDTELEEGLFTVNGGIALRTRARSFEVDRLYVGRSLLMTHPRLEEFRAGIGFSF